ncbi:outer membrane lipid asymmetry maintenance protein MlaD [Pseudogemmobacter sp. W21_MBD1_M6]|jgi:phospholipid/cholesterol/gamma-HCH transport system substrate-binding protein|uniref:outer membrane lipid asymmetry maintenance protein MlaD n=1 Tax=Pseudogemmobacter sp. W21_MBD1_M6 TaxID=3240271 RepID=UPI003F989304
MSENTTEVIVGGVVLAAAIGFVVFAGQATGFSRAGGDYPLVASFRSAEGIEIGSDVRLAGVKIGTVTGLELNAETFRAQTRVAIVNSVQIPDDSAIVVASEGLLGGNFVEIMPGGSLTTFAPGDEIEDTQGSVSLVSLLMKFVAGSTAPAEVTN